MKNTLIALAAITTVAFAPRPAAALGDKEAAILGGIIGGVVIGAAIDNALDGDGFVEVSYHHSDRGRHDRGDYRGNRGGDRHDRNDHGDRGRRDWDRGRDHGRDRDYGHGHNDRHRGHWTYRTVKVWIPKRTYYTYDRWGNRVRHFERGYWTHRREKVWVPNRGRW
ncbi:hypothetical protein [Synoicihabitans lomoniglobus]|uniref:Glycine zipper domain-containing protein n=1 Tax=Synoicihabitans lomoniglobus TaxID=2909285 RepID=A0AAF0CPL2_9BACT|nr:hypothetical protein [Opitutaceae bacterium LMO-M01]WED65329.1 hypothetical protein PXH66_00515 [Opitutaceae bacterium LMO-M01]